MPWATDLRMISHCWVTAPEWDLPAWAYKPLHTKHIIWSPITTLKCILGGAVTTMASLSGDRLMGKQRTNRSACISHALKAGELGYGAGCWVPTTAAHALGTTHRPLFHMRLVRRITDPVLPQGPILGLPVGTKTAVCPERKQGAGLREAHCNCSCLHNAECALAALTHCLGHGLKARSS